MSVYKRCSSTSRKLNRMKEMVEYVFDERKTREELCHTSGVGRETAFEDMLFIKRLFGKTEGRAYLHWVLSHDKGVSDKVADAVALEVLRLLQGKFQIVMATHINTRNIHTHFLINTVDVTSGKKFSESVPDMLKFRDKINQILRKYGLEPIGRVDEFNEETEDDFCENAEVKICIPDVMTEDIVYGIGSVEGGNVLIPGVYYCQDTKENKKGLVQGVFYEPYIFDIAIEEDGKTFMGKMSVAEDEILYPGILYEKTN